MEIIHLFDIAQKRGMSMLLNWEIGILHGKNPNKK